MREVIIYFTSGNVTALDLDETQVRGFVNWLNGSGENYSLAYKEWTHIFRRDSISQFSHREAKPF